MAQGGVVAMSTASQKRQPADWRADFPILKQEINGRKLAYLDSAASAQKPQVVLDAMTHAMNDHYANIHRGLYHFSQQTTTAFERARAKLAAFINADGEREIVFTRNATEAINLVAQSWARQNLEKGDEVILSEMEHHANFVPWHMLQNEIGFTIKYIPVHDDGTLDMDRFRSMLRPETKLISVVHVSNALGTKNDVKTLTHIAKDFYPEMTVMIDGSQAAVHGAVDVQDIGADFYCFTGHKLYGPTGVGVLWGRYDLLDQMPPYQGGGDMIETVAFDGVSFKPAPARFEAGTPAFVEAIALGTAIDYMTDIGMENIAAHEQALLAYATPKIKAVDGLILHGDNNNKCGILSFTLDWGHPSDVSMILDQCGVAVRSGHHCCMPLMSILGVDATIRASFGLYTNTDDIDALIAGLKKAKDLLG